MSNKQPHVNEHLAWSLKRTQAVRMLSKVLREVSCCVQQCFILISVISVGMSGYTWKTTSHTLTALSLWCNLATSHSHSAVSLVRSRCNLLTRSAGSAAKSSVELNRTQRIRVKKQMVLSIHEKEDRRQEHKLETARGS